MKILIQIALILILMSSCFSAQRCSTNMTEYWSKSPDLSKVIYEGGDGKSMANIVIIKNAENELNGVASEYAFISRIHGQKFTNWKPIGQSTDKINTRTIDKISIQTLPENEKITYYFDITDFYGKY
jgi:hypothetical protein